MDETPPEQTQADHFLSGLVPRRFGKTFPWRPFAVNVSGCLVMRLFSAFAERCGLAILLLTAATSGFLGSWLGDAIGDRINAEGTWENEAMQNPKPAQLVRIFVGEAARHEGKPLYEAIVLKARELGIAGATVLRGGMGYGHSSHLHTSKILRLSDDLPLVIEVVDSPDKVEAFLPTLEALMNAGDVGGLVTLENIQVLRLGRRDAS